MPHQPVNAGDKRFLIRQIGHANGAATNLVLIGRADAPPGGADLGHPGLAFARAVQFTMDRQDQAGIFRHHQVFRRDINALTAQLGDLHHQMPRVHHHAIANDRQLATPHNARGQQRQLVHLAVYDQRVTRVVAALKAGDHIGPL